MSSEDPRERDDLCGRELVPEQPWEENLADVYDPDSWYDDENGGCYCRREVWDGADTNRCIWHADIENKPAGELLEAWSCGSARLDKAVLRGSELPEAISFSDCRLWSADFRNADLDGANLTNGILTAADLRGASLENAEVRGADLQGADLRGANLKETGLTDAILIHADLSDAHIGKADLSDTVLMNANFTNSNCWHAYFTGADLREADLTDAALVRADLSDTTLREADFGNADLRDVNFGRCKLYLTKFTDAIIDESTDFGATSGYETEADEEAGFRSGLGARIAGRLRGLGRLFADPNPLEKAETQYRTVQRLKRENDLKQDPELEIREKHARRKRALAERRYLDWLYRAGQRRIIGYGENLWTVVRTSLLVILAAMLAYPQAGGFERTTGSTIPVADLSQALAVPEAVTSAVGPWLTSFYFSVVTFTTVGYGDLQPATEMGRLLASVESFLGALLMALLVFVLGRRATW